MSDFLQFLVVLAYLFGHTNTIKQTKKTKFKKHVCLRDMSKLDARTRIDIAIGCSKVNGKRVYSDYKLNRLYENET